MNYLEKKWNEYEKDLKGLISIKSYLDNAIDYPTPIMKEVLEYMVSLAHRDGIMTTYIDPEGYYGYIEIGQGEKLLGLLGHLDVVGPGDLESWNTEPFELTNKDGKLFGRGVQDDKGPVLLSYYLMKELLEEGNLKKRIRLIMGTDEETLWRGIEKYKEDKQEHVTQGITPDGSFPVTYSERALVNYQIKSNVPAVGFTLKGGKTFNAVPDTAVLTIDNNEKEFKGKTAHAKEPWCGDNAIVKAVNELDNEHPVIKFIKEALNQEVNGETIFGKIIKDENAELTINLGMINVDEKGAVLSFDSRLPDNLSLEEFEKVMITIANKFDLEYERYDYLQGVFIPKDSDIIKVLMETYQEITNDMREPMAIGGATYARGMNNVVAFGPVLKDTEKTEHQPNERITISEFKLVYDIYYKSFKKILNN